MIRLVPLQKTENFGKFSFKILGKFVIFYKRVQFWIDCPKAKILLMLYSLFSINTESLLDMLRPVPICFCQNVLGIAVLPFDMQLKKIKIIFD